MILNVLMLLVFIAGTASPSVFEPTRPFDEFGDIKCEDEMARLDSYALTLQAEPSSKGAIIFFAGKMAGDKLSKRGEAEARVQRVKSYLVQRRGVPEGRLVIINGGYDHYYRVQLWMVPPGAALPIPEWRYAVKDLRFRKGKPNPRDVRCRV